MYTESIIIIIYTEYACRVDQVMGDFTAAFVVSPSLNWKDMMILSCMDEMETKIIVVHAYNNIVLIVTLH